MGLPRIIPVQHHHAHIAAVLAENGEVGPVLGVAFDGTGYGDDGAVWGGELLLADLLGYRRMGHLRYVPLPGGDRAARAPWRVAAGYAALEPHLAPAFECAFEGLDPRERAATEWQIAAGVNTPHASSMGRLFDAAAAILGVRRVADYEGQAAMELEALAGKRIASEYRCGLEEGPDGLLILDPVPLLVRLGLSKLRGENTADLAADFHASIAWMTHTGSAGPPNGRESIPSLSVGAPSRMRVSSPRFGIGCSAAGLRVLTPRVLSPNDGAVSYGKPRWPQLVSLAKQLDQELTPMCLGIPGRIVEIHQDEGLAMGLVDFGGVRREVCLAYVEDQVQPGDYALVHVGFAIAKVDEDEARRTFEALRQMSQLEELDWMREVADRSLDAMTGGPA